LKIFLLSAATGKSFSKDDIKAIRGEFHKYMSKAAHVSLECIVPADDLLQFNKKNGGFWNLGWIEEVIRYRFIFSTKHNKLIITNSITFSPITPLAALPRWEVWRQKWKFHGRMVVINGFILLLNFPRTSKERAETNPVLGNDSSLVYNESKNNGF
jgi:hypothetical protein